MSTGVAWILKAHGPVAMMAGELPIALDLPDREAWALRQQRDGVSFAQSAFTVARSMRKFATPT